MFNIGLCEFAIILFWLMCFMNHKLMIVLKKGEIQRPSKVIYLCYNAGKTYSLIHIVNKSSTFNISEFVIVLFYCIAFIIIIIIVINDNEPKAFV